MTLTFDLLSYVLWCLLIGHPAPSLHWLKDGQLIDSSYQSALTYYETTVKNSSSHGSSGNDTARNPNHHLSSAHYLSPSSSPSLTSSANLVTVVNELLLASLARSDLFSVLSCQASNTNLSSPVATSVSLDISRKLATSYLLLRTHSKSI